MSAKITVIGIGDGGCNALNKLIASNLRGVSCIAANTDTRSLRDAQAEQKMRVGIKTVMGHGTKGEPLVGHEAAMESLEQIIEALIRADIVFIAAGMGGGTGTGAAPVIAKAAKEIGCLCVGVVTRPFFFEGANRLEAAWVGIGKLRKHVDSLIVIPNDRLLEHAPTGSTLAEMLNAPGELLCCIVGEISKFIQAQDPMTLDINDLRSCMRESGMTMIGTGMANGTSRIREAVAKALHNPLVEGEPISNSRRILMHITCGCDTSIDEIAEAASIVAKAIHDEGQMSFGTLCDEAMEGWVRITIVAAGA